MTDLGAVWLRSWGTCLLCCLLVCPLPAWAESSPPLPFQERIETKTQGGVSVAIAVPTRDESREIYGVDLAKREMQPVWIQVTNDRDSLAWLLPSGLDPDYYSASEAAFPFSSSASAGERAEIEARFAALQFRNPIPPKGTNSGYIIVNRDEGFKAVDVDIISEGRSDSFTFAILDPTFKGDFTQVEFDTLYNPAEIVDIDDFETLRQTIEKLPTCTSNQKGTAEGDPLNLVVVGSSLNIFSAFIRRGWYGTETMSFSAISRTTKSFLTGSRYRSSPVSSLYVFGRKQDIALQKARGTIHERNHLRLWLTPYRFRGDLVWLGQISRDIGVKLTLKSPTITTHVIDPDVDEARRYLVEDLAYSQAMTMIGFAPGVGPVDRANPRFNLVGDPFYSDGRRSVMFFDSRPYGLDDISFIEEWNGPSSNAARIVDTVP